jgi:glycoside/pentoside/hexuronide:cation symporter, GPH family
MLPWVMLADVIDRDELVTGKRREGLFSAVLVSLYKMAAGVALALSGVVRAAGGYVSANTPVSPELDWTFRLLCGIVPIGLAVAMIPFLVFYPITASAQRQLRRDLADKRRQLLEGAGPGADSATLLAAESAASTASLSPSPVANGGYPPDGGR